ncbi:DUF2332 family protein [Ensifer sp. BR816]|uniref:DUF2332 family protein n=1 Tax=Rhizobium sp. (strain BR816) TaxID=1057002 RepID=UPI0012FA0CB8|nr:DUF2332 family protein [Ensifer sp. BR816]
MPDGSAEAVRNAFRDQAKACEQLGSPFTARLCRLAAEHLNEKNAVGRRVLNEVSGRRARHLSLNRLAILAGDRTAGR